MHAFGAERVGMVRKHHSRRKENVVFDDGVLADVTIAMDADAIAEHAIVINGGAIPDGAICPMRVPSRMITL